MSVSIRLRETESDVWVISVLKNGTANAVGEIRGAQSVAVVCMASALQKMAFDLLESERLRLGIELKGLGAFVGDEAKPKAS